MTFHESFLDKTAAKLALEAAQTEVFFMTHWTRTTHKPRFARNRVRYGAAFTSAARALQYATTEIDVQYIYMLPISQCQIVDQIAPRTTIPDTLT